MKMIVTIDTNVIYQGLYSSRGASHQLLNMIKNDHIQLAISVPVFIEYSDVLQRDTTLEKTGLIISDINAVLDFLAYKGIQQKIFFLFRPNLLDETDNKFVELALASQSKYLITSNVKHFIHNSDLKVFGVKIITPGDFLRLWRADNG